ncbi:fatty acid--CoA ligase [Neisseria animalis]|uniref:Long-chain-fatty-acid--CoA ligase n=1 Tax=Neisseria animalis TaxID=492 RepID=A0A5P3MTQ2_NEIAN|nr:fatty acid--CoA ligase [Neisseria animalis]QEY24860.1 fatty acid--CoA ligase [Neisseria animalis]ROW32390.1 fatty acid--CoA ligase [Neisseria animalis]VEE08029.1 long-chain-fatty-acid--CoA ligase [Neisseria animalis]
MNYPYQNFYEMLSAACNQNGRGVVVYHDKEKISYRELKRKAEAVAAYLQSIDVKYGDKVAMVVSNSPEFIISYFAITAIGAVAVPVNTFLKHEEFEYILNDCQAKVMFASIGLSKELKGLKKKTRLEKVIWIGGTEQSTDRHLSFADALAFTEEPDLSRQPQIDSLAHIIYTSGTTGHPKGALISYKNLFSNMAGAHEVFHVRKKDRFMVFLPMFHSFTLTAMVLLPVFAAGSMILVKSVFPFSNVLKQALLKRATVFLGVPAIYTAMGKAKIPWYFRWFNRLRIFISGGAPLAAQTIADFKAKFPSAELLEGYGLSECSPVVAVNRLEKQKVGSVGLPLPGYQVKAVDEELVEVPLGEVGELIVKCDAVMQGYLNMPEATGETIVNGWLKTGDLVTIDSDGFIFIVDRKKDLIISKGQNVYPREIEEELYKIEAVEAAAVIGVPDQYADEEIVAFVQLKENMSIKETEIRAHLRRHLANFKVPKEIHLKDELPRNATGKVLKRVLKQQFMKE